MRGDDDESWIAKNGGLTELWQLGHSTRSSSTVEDTSMEQPQYLNDKAGKMGQRGGSVRQWVEIAKGAKTRNPDLPLHKLSNLVEGWRKGNKRSSMNTDRKGRCCYCC